ncbi:MAG: 3-dehydroquinate synthase [Candidatus Caldatribacterium sp.]|nr:3-dehydroquinate synthase [Candidatus Caldatribacterium sp.]
MREIVVSLPEGRTYRVLIDASLFSWDGWLSRILFPSPRGVILTNDRVGELYAEKVQEFFARHGYTVDTIAIPDGEEHKNLKTVEEVYHRLLALDLDRKSFLLTLGGGVVTDLGGFVASTFLRGIAYYQIPTSLLAQVDSSVGGKTGVNLEEGKNLVGTFYQPSGVLVDLSFLSTLPEREYREGLAEVVKAALLEGEEFVSFLLANRREILQREERVLEETVARAIAYKKGIVERDEKEKGLRSVLNYGHTIGHALEKATGYGVLRHGEAVGVGMLGEAILAVRIGVSTEKMCDLQRRMLEEFGLPLRVPRKVGAEEFLSALRRDKKKGGGKVRFTLLECPGKPILGVEVEEEMVLQILPELCEVQV